MATRARARPFQATGENSVLAFERPPGSVCKYLTVQGKRAYDLGICACDTCNFSFQRLDGAQQRVSTEELSWALRHGLDRVPDAAILSQIGAALPVGRFLALLLNERPRLTLPASAEDYFFHEQVDLFGLDNQWNIPHYCAVPYYRGRTIRLGLTDALFEFIVPLYPPTWMEPETIDKYQALLRAKNPPPTAAALSLLEVREPAMKRGPETSGITRHWCLAHFLLDGHHKVQAAAASGLEVGLLAFLALDECVATRDEIEQVLTRIIGE